MSVSGAVHQHINILNTYYLIQKHNLPTEPADSKIKDVLGENCFNYIPNPESVQIISSKSL